MRSKTGPFPSQFARKTQPFRTATATNVGTFICDPKLVPFRHNSLFRTQPVLQKSRSRFAQARKMFCPFILNVNFGKMCILGNVGHELEEWFSIPVFVNEIQFLYSFDRDYYKFIFENIVYFSMYPCQVLNNLYQVFDFSLLSVSCGIFNSCSCRHFSHIFSAQIQKGLNHVTINESLNKTCSEDNFRDKKWSIPP